MEEYKRKKAHLEKQNGLFLRVIRLGLEPRTHTLKVYCSTNWATESAALFPKATQIYNLFFGKSKKNSNIFSSFS